MGLTQDIELALMAHVALEMPGVIQHTGYVSPAKQSGAEYGTAGFVSCWDAEGIHGREEDQQVKKRDTFGMEILTSTDNDSDAVYIAQGTINEAIMSRIFVDHTLGGLVDDVVEIEWVRQPVRKEIFDAIQSVFAITIEVTR